MIQIRLFISYITFFLFGIVIAKNRKEANDFIEKIDDSSQMVP